MKSGTQVIPYQYASASAFTEDGLATVTDDNGYLAVIDETGEEIVPMRAAPASVEYENDTIAFRYENETVYFNQQGESLGTFPGAAGFFSEEGLLQNLKTAHGNMSPGTAVRRLPRFICRPVHFRRLCRSGTFRKPCLCSY